MQDSYDPVTPKRRPTVRIVLAVLVLVLIATVSVGNASVSEVEVAGDATATPASEVDESQPSTLDLFDVTENESSAGEDETSAEESSGTVSLNGNESLNEQQPAAAASIAGALNARGLGRGDSQDVASGEDDAFRARAEEFQAQLDAAAAAAEAVPLTVGERAVELANDLGVSTTEADAQAAWDAGYTLGGGANLSAFQNIILPCESGGQPNRDSVVGFTDDWGRAQINRPVWNTTFESLTGLSFEENIVRPALNGFMAAHIEQVQGLTAWTCWNRR